MLYEILPEKKLYNVFPFFQLEEKKKGIKPQQPEIETTIPQRWNPFDTNYLLNQKPLSGHDVFMSQNWPCDVWMARSGQDPASLTCKFEDSFVEMWAEQAKGKGTPVSTLLDKEKDVLFEDEDPVFKTVPGKMFV